jgi:predicted phosphodiesterase
VNQIERLVVSDIHDGLGSSRSADLPAAIARWDPPEIVFNGDTWDSAPYKSLAPWLDYLKEQSTRRRLIFVGGNHDNLLAPHFAAALGAICVSSYSWRDAAGLSLAVHGHLWDDFVEAEPTLTQAASEVYAVLQEVLGPAAAQFLKRAEKIFSRNNEKIRAGALKLAVEFNASRIFCGHTHAFADGALGESSYFNDGCACKPVGASSYFTLRADGFVEKHDF